MQHAAMERNFRPNQGAQPELWNMNLVLTLILG
eukprot:CAMPEP_0197653658 /NCGR_PEP_ID=MMETSP1338-20131121/36580_1 /TAXON_ID=43686 ORGANISM="Pelagodinium beii, Strain RCC1491" /NCGR_SAMPLE_ID=MMETSP1338 /ASSEMBLY_ACC=CAM_ASM_000754 /LENGTH=32 /DNA_ID= /DNA_START= /DNA_END= /DNA_ORIENTATION=